MDMTAERAENLPRPSTETPANTAEAQPRSPFRRRLLKAAVGVLAAESLLAGGLWGKDQFDKFFARPDSSPVTQRDVPDLPKVDQNIPISEKAINRVPLSELTKNSGIISIEPYLLPTSAEDQYGFSLSFLNLTIVHVEKNEANRTAWVALAMPGDRLERKEIGRSSNNFDGTKVEHFFYKGLTPWVLIDDRVITYSNVGSNRRFGGLAGLESSLKVGNAISFLCHMNQFNKPYQEINLESFNLLSRNLGKSNADRSGQTFKFVANVAFINPNQQ